MNCAGTADIRAVVCDIDGVLTDGRIGFDGVGEIKFFHARDEHGLKLAKRAGLKIGALSGRCAAANRQRAADLGFDFLYEGERDKAAGFGRLLEEQGLTAAQCMYIGDDVVDLPVLRRAGIAVAVADGAAELDEVCDFRTVLPGGKGAVREAIEWLLKEQDKWESIIEKYRR